MGSELITLNRDCAAVLIPSGVSALLFEGEKVYLTQTLGGSFTVQRDNGQLVRIHGLDADALGKKIPAEMQKPATQNSGQPLDEVQIEQKVWEQLRNCYDPEIPVNVVDLGLIYGCTLKSTSEGKRVEVTMTLTAPGCGMSTVLKSDIEARLQAIPGIHEALVDVTFDPPWDQSRMTEAARLQLGMF
jgi:probable FeS assembly SUF system protein SufT